MTAIRELYEWAIKNDVADLPVGLQCQDGGGSYDGDTFRDMGSEYDISAEVEASDTDKYVLLY